MSSASTQEQFFFRMFPDQVDPGAKKPTTLDWLLSRTRDGSQENAPREVIHFLTSLRTEQMKRFEVGESEPDGESLFLRASFKDALPEVSNVRLTQTLYAEYPEHKLRIEALRGEKAIQTHQTLASIWGLSVEESSKLADRKN